MPKKKSYILPLSIVGILLLALLTFVILSRTNRTWRDIQDDKIIRVVTSYHPINYCIVDGKPSGFGLELIKLLSDSLDYSLDITIENSPELRLRGLKNGDYDIMLDMMPITTQSSDLYYISRPLAISKLMLFQSATFDTISPQITNIEQLDGKTIYIEQGSQYEMVLTHIRNEVNVDFTINYSNFSSDMLYQQVISHQIQYAAIDYAYLSPLISANADSLLFALGFDQLIGWAVADKTIQTHINDFIDSLSSSRRLQTIKNKYNLK